MYQIESAPTPPPSHAATLREIAEWCDSFGHLGHAEQLRAAADALERLEQAVETVVSTFERDEAQGYRSRDRQFAIDLLRRVSAFRTLEGR